MGDLGIVVGGINVAPPIIAENFVFVPLLALGCYHVGRLAFDRTAGALAVVFALGSPLITAQFHVFMTDAPETAMVAVSLWAILATDSFARVRISAAAGVAVGLGLLTKEPFVFFVAGPVAVTAFRGGRKAWRGQLAFTLAALLVALPWYVTEFTLVGKLGSSAIAATGDSALGSNLAPAPLSLDNLEWYFWNMLDAQLYAPLFAFAAIGWLWTIVGFVRRRPVSRFASELTIGAFVAWLAITETFIRDTRYSMPLLVYLAVFGVGWLTRLPRPGRAAAATTLALVGAVNIVGTSFGDGPRVNLSLPAKKAGILQGPRFLTLFSSGGFLVSGPERDGDMLATLRALRHDGIRAIALEPTSAEDSAFSPVGIVALDIIAELATISEESTPVTRLTEEYAILRNAPVEPSEVPPCLTLTNGTGVWIKIGSPGSSAVRDYCPSRHPQFYGK